MKMNDLLNEEGYDKKRDSDAVKGIPRKNNFTPATKGSKRNGKETEKKAVDAVKKQFTKENTASAVSAVAMPLGNTISRAGVYNSDGTIKNALDATKKKSKKRKNK